MALTSAITQHMANKICQNLHWFTIVTITSVTSHARSWSKNKKKYSKILTYIQIWQ